MGTVVSVLFKLATNIILLLIGGTIGYMIAKSK